MARVDNLENFLTDVAGAIREKKGTQDQIPAENFDTEIKSITSGLDTSDATATANDILAPETAYAKGEKITGNIIPTYTQIDKQLFITSIGLSSSNILDINTKYNLIATGTMHSSNSVNICKFDGSSIGATLLTITASTWNSRTLSSFRFSKDVDSNGKLNVWFVCGPNSNNCYVSVAQLDLTTYTLSTAVHATSGYTRDNKQCAGEVNPVYNNVIGVGLQGDLGNVTSYNIALAILKYDCNAGTLTRLAYDQAYGSRMVNTSYYEFEWSSDGSVCMVAGPRFGSDTQGIIGRYYNSTNTYSRVKDFSGSVYFCMWNGSYYFINNTLANLSNTTVKTYSQLASSTYKWTYDNVLFCWSGSTITAYDIDTTSLDLTLLGSYSIGSIKGESYGGSVQRPYSNDSSYICNSNSSFYKIKILSGEIISDLNRDGVNYKYLDPTISTSTSSVLSGKKYYDGSGLKTGTMPNNGELNYTPSTEEQTIPAGYTSGGTISALGTPDNSFADTNAEVYNKIQNQYENMQPRVLTNSDKTIDKNIYFIPVKKDGTPLLDTSQVTNMQNMFNSCSNLTTIPGLNTSNVTNMEYTFNRCTNLTTIPLLDTSQVTNMHDTFNRCTNLTTIPELNTSNVINMNYMFNGCTNLTTIPELDTSTATNMVNMFAGCSSLSDDSLNNIMQMCANATSYTRTKTLKDIGLTSEQADKCKTLSNYSAFTSAGWTTGY